MTKLSPQAFQSAVNSIPSLAPGHGGRGWRCTNRSCQTRGGKEPHWLSRNTRLNSLSKKFEVVEEKK